MMLRLAPLAFFAAACAPYHPIQMPTLPQGQVRAAPLPEGPDVTREAMGYLLVHDAAKMAEQLNPQLGGHASTAELAKSIGLDGELAKALDLHRPMALAMLNPSLLSSAAVRPY